MTDNPNRFIAFDVETPNHLNHRMSAIGIAVIENGAVTEEFYSLVDPETDFDYFNTVLTGIDEDAVRGAPTFPELWPEIEPLLGSGILVAHNAGFDMGVLKRCLQHYGIEWKRHHAGSDSRACAEILLRYLRGGADIKPFLRSYSLV